jgi:sRNA-binding regulator protein Hfq
MNDFAPNLVIVEKDELRKLYYKHAFNTQVSLELILLRCGTMY